MLAKLCKVVGAYIFIVNNKTLLCTLDHYSNFSVVRKMESMSAKTWYKQSKLSLLSLAYPRN